jgi:putative hydroxymethylpyrimidine transport system substrate-binding protein
MFTRHTHIRYAATLLAASLAAPMVASAGMNCDGGPAEVKEITVMADWLPWASQGPMMAAQIKGYYEDEGLAVTIIAPANPADPIKLVARERVNFSLTYVPEVMLARETGIPVVSVAASMRILGSGLFYLADSPIASPKDLEDMTLGVGPKQDAQAFLATLLGSEGLTKADVKVVDPGFAHVPMVLEKKMQASHGLVFGEGVVADEILMGGGKDPVKWLLYRDFGVPNFYYQLFVGNEDWVKRNANATCRFLRATRKGTDEWLKNPDPTLAVISDANTAFSPKQHRGIFDATVTHWKEADGAIFVQDPSVWQKAQDWAMAQKLISVPSDPSTYFTNDYLPE